MTYSREQKQNGEPRPNRRPRDYRAYGLVGALAHCPRIMGEITIGRSDNHDWTDENSMFPRFAVSNVEEALADTPAVFVMGLRQSGKTTLIRTLIGET